MPLPEIETLCCKYLVTIRTLCMKSIHFKLKSFALYVLYSYSSYYKKACSISCVKYMQFKEVHATVNELYLYKICRRAVILVSVIRLHRNLPDNILNIRLLIIL